MQSNSTIFWLKLACAAVIGFGILTAAAALPITAAPTLLLTDMIIWPLDGAQSLAAPETRLLCAIAGGIMTGWGVLLWLVTTQLYLREPELARTMILYSAGAWFAVDSLASIAAGAHMNPLFNIGFLAMFVLPLRQRSKRLAT
jgi:hypothetical protein